MACIASFIRDSRETQATMNAAHAELGRRVAERLSTQP